MDWWIEKTWFNDGNRKAESFIRGGRKRKKKAWCKKVRRQSYYRSNLRKNYLKNERIRN